MAYEAGAELLGMEFTQFFIPTGMIWPPSVRGILVTEGVRGDGGVLLNSKGEPLHVQLHPRALCSETADSVEEAERWLEGDEGARRPPELLTRDVVARAITNEVNEGRGSPHGGAFLDIASRRPADFIKRKLPVDVPSVQRIGGCRYHEGTNGSRTDAALFHGWYSG